MAIAVAKSPTKQSRKRVSSIAATALHLKNDEGHVVGIGNLRVVIVQDGPFWFAQGLEIDYAAQGSSEEDVRKQFEDGLFCTIDEHLTVFGKITNFLKPAPVKVWKDLLYDPVADVNRYSQLSWHESITPKPVTNTPFEGIRYLQQKKAA